jgi:prolipoprotein diacylglyceryltransferase
LCQPNFTTNCCKITTKTLPCAGFFIEKIRINNIIQFAGFEFTQAELISSLLILLGISGAIWSIKNAKKG